MKDYYRLSITLPTGVWIFLIFCFTIHLLTSCTVSVNMTDTHGRARDVGEESTEAVADVEAEIPLRV